MGKISRLFFSLLILGLISCGSNTAQESVLVDRDIDSIRTVIESAKDRSYLVYQRIQKSNPEFGGEIQFKFIVQADGSVTNLELISNHTGSEAFGSAVLDIIGNTNFGEMSVKPRLIMYKFNYIPPPVENKT